MGSRRNRNINLPAPYLKRVWIEPTLVPDREAYPFCLPFLHDDFSLSFDRAITIIVGENGTGKSTLLEGLAVLAGFDEAGGGKGYSTVDHSMALEENGGELTVALCASWVPKITNGCFFSSRVLFLGRAISGRSGKPDGRFPLLFTRRRVFALLRGTLPTARPLHLRRAGIGAVAVAPDGILEVALSHGQIGALPGDHGDSFACPDGLSQRDAAAVPQIRAAADDTAADRSLQSDARVFCRPKGFVEAAIVEVDLEEREDGA
jgi:energy-coupling factor transporter ATP-binding protein EcfA2